MKLEDLKIGEEVEYNEGYSSSMWTRYLVLAINRAETAEGVAITGVDLRSRTGTARFTLSTKYSHRLRTVPAVPAPLVATQAQLDAQVNRAEAAEQRVELLTKTLNEERGRVTDARLEKERAQHDLCAMTLSRDALQKQIEDLTASMRRTETELQQWKTDERVGDRAKLKKLLREFKRLETYIIKTEPVPPPGIDFFRPRLF